MQINKIYIGNMSQALTPKNEPQFFFYYLQLLHIIDMTIENRNIIITFIYKFN